MSVEIRKYESQQAFQQDAGQMAAAGWHVAAQTQGSRLSSGGSWIASVGVLLVLLGFVALPVLIIGGIIALLIGAFMRQPTFVVTYEWRAG